ncbi:ankyrin repeat-containing domain protein [Aspergillus insuetus]
MDDAVWDSYKLDLHQLYIRQNKKLSEVMEYMASHYTFEATKRQYAKYFARWEFRKYQKVSSADSVFIERRINKRKQRFGKESEVYVNGEPYAAEKIKKARYGKSYISTLDAVRATAAPSPRTPDGIVVCTPVSPGMNIHWNNSIPWLSASRIETVLRIFVPEAYEGEHHALATRFCGHDQTTLDTFKITMFFLSNNLVPRGNRTSHDQRVLKMLRESGFDKPTAVAIIEQLFGSALREYDIDIVRMLLDACMSPDCLIDGNYTGNLWDGRATDPMGLLDLLLSHGADIDKSGHRASPLEEAWFLTHGAEVTRSCIAAAAETIYDPQLFEHFLQSDYDIIVWEDDEVCPLASASSSGNLNVTKLLLSRGADVNALVQCEYMRPCGWTTVLGYACDTEYQNPEVIRSLIAACPDINHAVDDCDYVSPLTVAVTCIEWDYDVIELLLRGGIDIHVADTCKQWTLLEIALWNGPTRVCDLLLRYGAMIDRPLVSGVEQPASALFCAIEQGATDLAAKLIAIGARLNDMYSSPPGTVLSLAIGKGYLSLIKTLKSAGAIAIGLPVHRIGKFETAVHLEESGHLQHILNISGGQILGAAIATSQLDLAEGLLGYPINLSAFTHHQSAMTPLQAAISAKQLSFAYTLLERGAHVSDGVLEEAVKYFHSREDRGGLLPSLLAKFHGRAPTAMAEAISLKRPGFVQLILEFNVDPTGKPTFDLAERLYLSEVKWKPDPTINLSTDPPESVLEVLCRNPYRAILAMLLAACPWAPGLVGRALALSVALRRYELVDDLLRAPGSLETNTKNDEIYIGTNHITPLQLAAKIQDLSIVKRLVEHHSIDINYVGQGEYNRTALQHAVEDGNMELVNLLISHGANINAPPAPRGGATALQLAAIRGYLGIARRLIDLGAKVNAPGAKIDGRTALEGAAEHGRIDMLQMLLDEGASVTGGFGEGQYRRAIELAERQGHQAAARLLINFEPRQT